MVLIILVKFYSNDFVNLFAALATADEFTFEIKYKDSESQENLQNSVALNLVRQHRDVVSGLVALVFNVVYNPYKEME